MRLRCFMPPCRQRSELPGRSRLKASYRNFTCLQVDANTRILDCSQATGFREAVSSSRY